MTEEDDALGFPHSSADERELLLAWLGFLRGAVLRKVEGITDEQARWRPAGPALISLAGIVNHLTNVEWRWIDGGILGRDTNKDESEYTPGPELPIATAITRYRHRATATDAVVRATPLSTSCRWVDDGAGDLRWVLLHLINETARHAGHADATRELLDGVIGE
jgi:hypothetical protein